MLRAYSECHTRSAKRVLKALLANGGAGDFYYHRLKHMQMESRFRRFYKTGTTRGFAVRSQPLSGWA